ncbi:MAG: right-handed parallel beta-helix repeat-containing protein, partial [Planctomycetota bacterium]
MRSITRPLVLTIAVLTTFAVRADVLNVPADFPTIQAAVDAAQSGDEIVLAPGTYESPGIMIDRSLQVTIRSTDPSDPGVVASTVLTDADDSGLMVVNAGEGESIDLSVRGLTIRRADVQNTDRFIELLGATSRFDRCRFEGGAGTTAAGTILVADRGMTDDLSASHVTNSEFVGDVGAAIYIDTTTSWTEVVVRDGNGRISWDAPDGHTLRLTDTSFSNLGVSSRPRVEIDHDVGPDTAVLERVSFTDIPGIGLRAEPSATLRDVVVERCGSLLSEIAFIEVTDLTIDGLVVRDCTLSEQQLVWFVYASRELVARNMLFEGNSGAELWLHGTTDDQEGGAIIEDSIFRNNISNIAVVEAHQSVTYRRCTFEGNLGGSPILIWGRATSGTVFNANILITECTFRNNSGFEAGGINLAWGIVGPPVIVERSVFEGNTGGLGGAVSTTVNRWTGSSDFLWVVLRNSLIVGNTGGEGGSHHGNARYESSTVVDNAGGAAALGIG